MGIGAGKEGKQIFSFAKINFFILIVFVTGIMFIVSCTQKYEFTMGNDFIDSQTRLQVIDTFKVDLSTVLLDSIPASSTKVALIGSHVDKFFGSVKCETYFDLAYQTFPEIDEKAIYDSSVIVMVYSGYSYGDTLSQMSLNVHMLAENIEPYANGSLYNNSSFDYLPEVTGSASFYPSPNSADTSLSIPVNTLGEELFNLIKEKDENLSSADWFSDYIKGFLITSGNTNNKAVIGFVADKDNIFLRIYYHLEKEELIMKEITIEMGLESHQFNNVNYDPSGTPLDDIKTEKEISANQSDNKGYMQGMTGLMSKMRFPTLQSILAVQRWKILRAELIIRPGESSYSDLDLSGKMYLYETDRKNRINWNYYLMDDKGNALIPIYEFDELYAEEARYTFDITNFLNAEFADAYFDYDHGLLLGFEYGKFRSSLDRLLIEGKNPPVKLKIYFLTY